MAITLTEKQAVRLLGARSARGTRHGADPPRGRATGPRRAFSKYHAQRTTVDGFQFASKAEALRYQQLVIRGLAGEIRNLELQPRFPLCGADGSVIGHYVADFRYEEAPYPQDLQSIADWRDVVEDVKSPATKTPVYRLKARLFKALYGWVDFREVMNGKTR